MAAKLVRTTALILLVAYLGFGSEQSFAETRKKSKKLWAVSVVCLVAASALDAGTSLGRYELNPLLRDPSGRFDVRKGLLVKSAASGGSLVLQALLFRAKHQDDLYKPAAFVNFAAAGAIGAIAVSNFGVPKPTVAPGYLTPP